jgi:hypothetical protein
VETLFEMTKPSKNPSLDLLSSTEGFLHYYALSCLQMKRDSDAVHATEFLLQRFPRHKLNPSIDPPAFTKLLDSIIPYPIHQIGFYLGARASVAQLPAPIDHRSDLSTLGNGRNAPKIINAKRIDFGFERLYNIGFRSGIGTGVSWEALGFNTVYNSPGFSGDNPREGDWTVTLKERYDFVQVPLRYQYRFNGRINGTKKTRSDLFVEFGSFGRALVRGQARVAGIKWHADNSQELSSTILEGPPPRRQLFAIGGIAGVGYHLDFETFILFARLSGQLEWVRWYANVNRYPLSYENLFWEYQVADQYAQLNSLSFAVGISLPKNYRVKNFKVL